MARKTETETEMLDRILFDSLAEHVRANCWEINQLPGQYLVLCDDTPAAGATVATDDLNRALKGTALEGKVRLFFRK